MTYQRAKRYCPICRRFFYTEILFCPLDGYRLRYSPKRKTNNFKDLSKPLVHGDTLRCPNCRTIMLKDQGRLICLNDECQHIISEAPQYVQQI